MVLATVDLRKFIHQHDDNEEVNKKLYMMRELCLPEVDPPCQEDFDILEDLYIRIADALCLYAKGKHDTVKPYGINPSRSTTHFKQLPDPILAVTYAVMYQAARTPPDTLEKWQKQPRPNITSCWPGGMMSRFLKLQKSFRKHRATIFETYDKVGGPYVGVYEGKKTNKRKRDAEHFSQHDEDEDFWTLLACFVS